MGKVKILPNNNIQGEIRLPASKSVLHRAIIAGCLTKGTSIVYNISLSLDVLSTINACIKLGANIEIQDNTIKIEGFPSFDLQEDVTIDCGESGTTLRLLIPICTLFNRNIKIIGKESLFVRPLGVYQELFEEN